MNQDMPELQWLAFQYIAGELSESESVAFEERLQTDQVAREAVAAAVELADATARAEQYSSQPQVKLAEPIKFSWNQLAWMACGAALCLIMLLVVQPIGLRQLGFKPRSQVVSSGPQSPELALAWAQTRVTIQADDAEVTDVSGAADQDEGTDHDLETPSWMLTAVVGLTAGMDEIE